MNPFTQPPVELRMPHGWEIVFTVLILVPTTAALAWAAAMWLRSRDPVPLLFLAGGAVCTLLEPLVDVLGNCWYPARGQTRLFELLGRPIPFFVLPGYVMFMGGCSMAAYALLRRYGPAALWRALPLFAALELVFEYLAVHTGTYVYYGDQPLRLLGFPLWWSPVDCSVPVAAAVAWCALGGRAGGWRRLTVIALLPMLDAAVNAGLAWPVWLAMGSGRSRLVLEGAGVLTCGLAALCLVLLIGAPPVRRPVARSIPARRLGTLSE